MAFTDQAYVVWRHFVLNTERDRNSKLKKFDRGEEFALTHKIIGNYQPSTFASKITHNKDFDIYKNFLDLQTHKLTTLVPEFKFYKVEDKKYTPFYFPQSAEEMTRASILDVGSTRAVAVQDFSIEYTGKDTATAEKMLNFNLTLYTDNIKNIFSDSPIGYAKLAELFTIYKDRTHLKAKSSSDKKVPESSVRKARSAEIAAYVGYSLPYNAKEFMTGEEIRTIENSKLHLRLTYIRHTINVQQNGSATISIQYAGRMFSILSEKSYDVLASKVELVRLAEYRKELKQKLKKTNSAQNRDAIEELKTVIQERNQQRMREIVEDLEEKGLLYDYEIDSESRQVFLDFEKKYIKSRQQNKELKPDALINENLLKSLPRAKSRKREISDPENLLVPIPDPSSVPPTKVGFFYLGDLISAVTESTRKGLEQAKESIPDHKPAAKESIQKDLESLESMRILLGSALISVASGEYKSVNLADMPISLQYFQNYFFQNITQNYTNNYSLAKFLQDCATKLIPGSLKGHGLDEAKFLHGTVGVKSMEVTGPKLKSNKPDIDIRDLPGTLSRIPTKLRADEFDYFIMYGTHPDDAKLSRRGSRRQDLKNGIYHFYLGRDRGVLKEANFTMMDIKYRKEALMISSANLYDQLKMPYNVSLQMIGNTAFLPGSLFFIDPSTIGMGNPRDKSSAAFQIGLGGYYQAKSVKISFSGGRLDTSVEGVQVAWAEDEQELIQNLDSYISTPSRAGRNIK